MTAGENHRRKLRLTGIAGIIGAICWTIGDAAIVGENAQPRDYPLLLIRYADRIDFMAWRCGIQHRLARRLWPLHGDALALRQPWKMSSR